MSLARSPCGPSLADRVLSPRRRRPSARLLRAALPWLLALLTAAALWPAPLPAQTPGEPAPGEPAPAPILKLPSYTETECPFFAPWGDEVSCGLLRVPERRSTLDADPGAHPDAEPGAEFIELFVTILHSRGKATDDPVLVLPGGPGGGALGSRIHFYALKLRTTRTVILLDPRGTGLSRPSLDCFEVSEPDELQPDLTAAYAACAERLLAEGRDLSAYGSAEQVEDVADLALALGIERLNLYATSYGTRVAVQVANRYPALVRSMVLDSVLPLSVNALLEEPLNTWAVFLRVAQDCAADPACNAAFPALEVRLLAVIDRYNQTPLPGDIGYGSGDEILRLLYQRLYEGGATLPALITAFYTEDFARACALLPPDTGCWFADAAAAGQGPDAAAEATLPHPPGLPAGAAAEQLAWLLHELDAASPAALAAQLELLAPAELDALLGRAPHPARDGFSEGAFASVLCSEEAPFYTTDDVALIAQRIPPQLGDLPVQRAADVAALCAFWPVTPVSPAAKVSDLLQTPTLVVGGTHDPITPPVWARRAAAYLEASRVVLFPGRGHGVLAGDDPCMDQLLARFYANPRLRTLPLCVNDLHIDWQN